ncbi:hypothetical protein D3C76_792220 [compost metagenome]
MSAWASSMNWVPMALPTPREPLCSMNQTRSASSRQTSMKWLPVPRVPRCWRLLVLSSCGYFAVIARKRPARARQASSAACGTSSQAPRSWRPKVLPWGTAFSMALRRPCRLSGRSRAFSEVRAAIMPQPMSTPTAAGMMAPSVGITLPMVEPLPRCTSGITARCLKMNGIFAVFSSCWRASSSSGTPRVQSLIGLPPEASSMVGPDMSHFLPAAADGHQGVISNGTSAVPA